ncbi:MAG TPA: hypothetical protein HPQ00_00990 [Magnetococcales bacterium]|nr:hypothetical protein [Magnetococcales bacterium]
MSRWPPLLLFAAFMGAAMADALARMQPVDAAVPLTDADRRTIVRDERAPIQPQPVILSAELGKDADLIIILESELQVRSVLSYEDFAAHFNHPIAVEGANLLFQRFPDWLGLVRVRYGYDSLRIVWRPGVKAAWVKGNGRHALRLKRTAELEKQTQEPEESDDPMASLHQLQARLMALSGAPSLPTQPVPTDKTDAGQVQALADLAALQEQAGMWMEALETYDKALRQKPNDPDLQKNHKRLVATHAGTLSVGTAYADNRMDGVMRQTFYGRFEQPLNNRLRLKGGLADNHIDAIDPWPVFSERVNEHFVQYQLGLIRDETDGARTILTLAARPQLGFEATHEYPAWSGSWEGKLRLRYPDENETVSLLHQGVRDQVGLARRDQWGSEWETRLFAAANRYHLSGFDNAARSYQIQESLQWRPGLGPLHLQYDFSREYPQDLRFSSKEDGSLFSPYPIPRNESHALAIGWNWESAILADAVTLSETFNRFSREHVLALSLVSGWRWADDARLNLSMDVGLTLNPRTSRPFLRLQISHDLFRF